ncbi:hypothetical protein GmHk_20G057992 [Glycine max]|nr:hypothetical protein GmHk_20G057992 [Glycine max]
MLSQPVVKRLEGVGVHLRINLGKTRNERLNFDNNDYSRLRLVPLSYVQIQIHTANDATTKLRLNSSKGVRSNPLSDFGILKNFSVDIHPRKAKIIKQPRLVVLHAKRRLMSLFWRVRAYMKRQIKARSNNNTTFNYDPFSYSLNFDDGNFRFFILPNIATIYLAPQR